MYRKKLLSKKRFLLRGKINELFLRNIHTALDVDVEDRALVLELLKDAIFLHLTLLVLIFFV